MEETGLLDGVLLKPVTPAMLAETLHRLRSEPHQVNAGLPNAPWCQVRAAAALPGTRLLLVEDNPVNQQLARELLEQEGAEVSIAENGQVALALLDERGPSWFDAALVDLQMPVMDGYETARRIRADAARDADNLPADRHDRACDARGARTLSGRRHAGPPSQADRSRAAGGSPDPLDRPDERLRAARDPRYRPLADRAGSRCRTAASASACGRCQRRLLASLPGIDTADGLKRCGGDGRLYADLLDQFHKIYGDAAAEVVRLRAAGKMVEAHRLVHRPVKGAAANLGMIELATRRRRVKEDALEEE